MSEFVYVMYVEGSGERVWRALTDRDETARYWGHSNVSDWQAGSRWEHQRTDGSHVADVVGIVVESQPPVRLVTTWDAPGGGSLSGGSRVTFEIEPYHDIVRLTVTHADLAGDDEREQAAEGWAAVLSNLKTFVETGHALPQAPWEMPN